MIFFLYRDLFHVCSSLFLTVVAHRKVRAMKKVATARGPEKISPVRLFVNFPPTSSSSLSSISLFCRTGKGYTLISYPFAELRTQCFITNYAGALKNLCLLADSVTQKRQKIKGEKSEIKFAWCRLTLSFFLMCFGSWNF